MKENVTTIVIRGPNENETTRDKNGFFGKINYGIQNEE